MTQPQLFFWMFVSLLLCVSGAREFSNRRYAMATLLIGFAAGCGWLVVNGTRP